MTKLNDRTPRKLWRWVRIFVRRISFSAGQSTATATKSLEAPQIPVSASAQQPTPINILPIKLLQQIFISCVSFKVTPTRNREVLRLCHVSSMWRTAAVETPELWSALAIPILHCRLFAQYHRKATIFWEFIEAWLYRSGIQELSISIQEHDPSLYDMNLRCAVCLKLVKILIPHARRIQYLRGLTQHTLEIFSQLPLPSLHSLIVYPDFSINSLSFLRSLAPNLREVSLASADSWGVFAGLGSPTMTPYCHQLTHLSITLGCDSDQMRMGIFSVCPNLEGIVLYCREYSWFTSTPQDPFAKEFFLPKLSTLTIVLTSGSLNLRLLRALKMPAIQTFHLGSSHPTKFSFSSNLETDLYYAYQQITGIRRLSLFFDSLAKGPAMERFFSNLPNLEQLDIQDCNDYEDLFARLTLRQSQPRIGLVHSDLPLLPRLRKLTLDIRQMGGFPLGNPHFLEFVSSQRILEPLFRVLIYVSGRARTIHWPMVRMAKKENLPINFAIWDEKIGSRGDSWKRRMEGEVERWEAEVPDSEWLS